MTMLPSQRWSASPPHPQATPLLTRGTAVSAPLRLPLPHIPAAVQGSGSSLTDSSHEQSHSRPTASGRVQQSRAASEGFDNQAAHLSAPQHAFDVGGAGGAESPHRAAAAQPQRPVWAAQGGEDAGPVREPRRGTWPAQGRASTAAGGDQQRQSREDVALDQLVSYLMPKGLTIAPRTLMQCLTKFTAILQQFQTGPVERAGADAGRLYQLRRQRVTTVAALLCRALVQDCARMGGPYVLSTIRMLTLMRSLGWLPSLYTGRSVQAEGMHTQPSAAAHTDADGEFTGVPAGLQPGGGPQRPAAAASAAQGSWRSELAAASQALTQQLTARAVELLHPDSSLSDTQLPQVVGSLDKLGITFGSEQMWQAQANLCSRIQQSPQPAADCNVWVLAVVALAKLGGPAALSPELLGLLSRVVFNASKAKKGEERLDARSCAQLMWLSAQIQLPHSEETPRSQHIASGAWQRTFTTLSGTLVRGRRGYAAAANQAVEPPTQSTTDSESHPTGPTTTADNQPAAAAASVVERWELALLVCTQQALSRANSSRGEALPITLIATLIAHWRPAALSCPPGVAATLLKAAGTALQSGSPPLTPVLQCGQLPLVALSNYIDRHHPELFSSVGQWMDEYCAKVQSRVHDMEVVELHWLVNQLVAAADVLQGQRDRSEQQTAEPAAADLHALLLSPRPWTLQQTVCAVKAVADCLSAEKRSRSTQAGAQSYQYAVPQQLQPFVVQLVVQHAAAAALQLAEAGRPALLGAECSRLRRAAAAARAAAASQPAHTDPHQAATPSTPHTPTQGDVLQLVSLLDALVDLNQATRVFKRGVMPVRPGRTRQASGHSHDGDGGSDSDSDDTVVMSDDMSERDLEIEWEEGIEQMLGSKGSGTGPARPRGSSGAQSSTERRRARALLGVLAVSAVRMAQQGSTVLPTPALLQALKALRTLGVRPRSSRWRGELQAELARRARAGELRLGAYIAPEAHIPAAFPLSPTSPPLRPVTDMLREYKRFNMTVGANLDSTLTSELLTWHLADTPPQGDSGAQTQGVSAQGGEGNTQSTAPHYSIRTRAGHVLDKEIVVLMRLMQQLGMPGSEALLDRLQTLLWQLAAEGRLRGKYGPSGLKALFRLGRPLPPGLVSDVARVTLGLYEHPGQQQQQQGAPKRASGRLDLRDAHALGRVLLSVRLAAAAPAAEAALTSLVKDIESLFVRVSSKPAHSSARKAIPGALAPANTTRVVSKSLQPGPELDQLVARVEVALVQLSDAQSAAGESQHSGVVQGATGTSQSLGAGDAGSIDDWISSRLSQLKGSNTAAQ